MLTVQVDAGIYTSSRPLAFSVSGVDPERGTDLLVAVYTAKDVLIAWQVLKRDQAVPADAQSREPFRGAINLAGLDLESQGLVLRAWQGTAGSGYGAGATQGQAVSLRGEAGFRVNSPEPPTRRDVLSLQRRITPGGIEAVLANVTVDTLARAPVLSLSRDTGRSSRDRVTTDGTVLVTGLEPQASWEYSLDGGETWAGGLAPTALAPAAFVVAAAPTPYAAGRIQARQTDVAGNTSLAGLFSAPLTVDTTVNPGRLQLLFFSDSGFSDQDFITADNTFDLLVSEAETGAAVTFQLSRNGGASWATTRNRLTRLADGTYQFRVLATDVAGNSATSEPVEVTVDTTPPAAPRLALGDPNSFPTVIQVEGLEPGSRWEYSLSGARQWQEGSGTTILLPGGRYEPFTIRVRQQDRAGNTSAAATLSSRVAAAYYVDDAGSLGFSTIQAAVDAAPAGATIAVDRSANPYSETVTVVQPDLTIRQLGSRALNLTLASGSLAARLVGSTDNDSLTGGPGNDWLTGGGGRDRFGFQLKGNGTDTITDFRVGSNGDVLDFRSLGLSGIDTIAGNNNVSIYKFIVVTTAANLNWSNEMSLLNVNTTTPDANGNRSVLAITNTKDTHLYLYEGIAGASGADINPLEIQKIAVLQGVALGVSGQSGVRDTITQANLLL